MTTDTLRDYDRLVETGFNDDQARALVELLAMSSETNPDVASALDRIAVRLDSVGETLSQLRAEVHIMDERMQSESRIQRMLNTTLIAIGALLGSLLAVFAR